MATTQYRSVGELSLLNAYYNNNVRINESSEGECKAALTRKVEEVVLIKTSREKRLVNDIFNIMKDLNVDFFSSLQCRLDPRKQL